MVDVNLSEEEQVEALKNWWKENGRSVIAGVVIGLGAVFGWQGWTQYQRTVAQQGGESLQKLQQAVAIGESESAEKQAEMMIAEFDGSTYSVLSSLELAKIKLAQGDLSGAEVQLRWALQNSSEPSLRQIARLRLARILLDKGETDAAAEVVASADKDGFSGEFAELKGDIALLKGDREAARAGYSEALQNGVSGAVLVQMKLDDLAPAAPPGT